VGPGTAGYRAPEQIQGGVVDGRADQYALGCAAFELLCGAVPFDRDQDMAVIYAHLSVPPPPLSSKRPGLPPAIDGVLARALAKVPGDRYASCREFAEALRAALGLPGYDQVAGAGAGGTRIIHSRDGLTWTGGVAPPPLAGGPGGIGSPYRGLGAFEEQDAGLFFGREAATAELLARMSRQLAGRGPAGGVGGVRGGQVVAAAGGGAAGHPEDGAGVRAAGGVLAGPGVHPGPGAAG